MLTSPQALTDDGKRAMNVIGLSDKWSRKRAFGETAVWSKRFQSIPTASAATEVFAALPQRLRGRLAGDPTSLLPLRA